jgi:sodium-dependent dicarboxylate transporter 2/3/5
MKNIKILSGPVLAAIIFVVCSTSGWNLAMCATLSLFGWMAAWWMTEAVSIYFTSLLPILIFPLCGVLPMDKLAPLYMNEIIFLFIGGFLLAFAMEKSGLHQRIALFILKFTPKTGKGVLGGVMTAAFIISMFINNTASTAMLLPAVLGLNDELNKQKQGKSIVAPLLLGLAFSASIGGMATTIGTAPNLIFLKAYQEHFPEAPITFLKWLQFGLPISLCIQTAAFFILSLLFKKSLSNVKVETTFIHQEFLKLGPPKRDEKIIGFLILILFAGFLLKDDIDFGAFKIYGFSNFLPDPSALKESTLIMFVCMLMYFIPSVNNKHKLLEWSDFKRVPIGVIFLFGGGFALSKGIEVSGLSVWITEQLQFISVLPAFLFLLFVIAIVSLMSEFASNVATMNILMAVIFNVLIMVDLLPQQVLIAVAMAASIGYALPAATPPNSIVFGTEMVKARDMIRSGLLLDAAAIFIVAFFCYFLVGYLF